MMPPAPPQTFDDWLAGRILSIEGKINLLMTQSDQLGADIAQLKQDVAREIQQLADALAAGLANATELASLQTAVTQAHADLTAMHDSLVADDPTPPAP